MGELRWRGSQLHEIRELSDRPKLRPQISSPPPTSSPPPPISLLTKQEFQIPILQSGRSARHLCSHAGPWNLICQQMLQEGTEKMVEQDGSDKKGSSLQWSYPFGGKKKKEKAVTSQQSRKRIDSIYVKHFKVMKSASSITLFRNIYQMPGKLSMCRHTHHSVQMVYLENNQG